jgi:hypothetical protein
MRQQLFLIRLSARMYCMVLLGWLDELVTWQRCQIWGTLCVSDRRGKCKCE